MAAPPFTLPPDLQAQFPRRARKAAKRFARADVAELAERHDVLPLVADVSGLLALRDDGMVVEIRWRSPDRAVPVHDLRTRDIAVVQGARIDPELRALRPERALGDEDCPKCQGTSPFEPTMPSVSCFCGGLGFLPAAWDEPEEEDDEPEPVKEVVVRRAAAVTSRGQPQADQPDEPDEARAVAEPDAPGGADPADEPDAPASRPRATPAAVASVRSSKPSNVIALAARSAPASAGPVTTLLLLLLAVAGGLAAVALGASHDLGSVGLALSCGAGMLPGVLLLAWVSSG